MTRVPTNIPDKIERKQYESDKSYLNRISKMVSKAMNDANIEQHFDVDLHGSIDDNGEVSQKSQKTSNSARISQSGIKKSKFKNKK